MDVGEVTGRESAAAGFWCGRWWSDIARDRGGQSPEVREGECTAAAATAVESRGVWSVVMN